MIRTLGQLFDQLFANERDALAALDLPPHGPTIGSAYEAAARFPDILQQPVLDNLDVRVVTRTGPLGNADRARCVMEAQGIEPWSE